MTFNYQYLHSEVRSVYKDLPVPVHARIPEELRDEAVKYSFIMDASDLSLQESFCYFMLQDSRDAINLFFSKTTRKMNSTSLAFFTQCTGWKFNNVYSLPAGQILPTDHFADVFSFPFFSEAEIDDYTKENSGVVFGKGSSGAALNSPITVAPEAIRAILHGVMARWDLRTAPVFIEVPAGVDYNTYVMNAVQEIYSYFPVALKCRVGFCSYIAPGNVEKYPAVSLLFVPSSMSNAKTIRLDGSTATAYQQLCDISFGSRIDAFVKHLAYLTNPAEREDFLKAVLIDAEFSAADNKISSITLNSYSVLGDGLRILKLEGSPLQNFSEWYDFVANYKNFARGMSTQIFQNIDSQLSPDIFDKILHVDAAFPQPQNVSEVRGVLEKLYVLCRKRADLRPKLWDYVQRTLTNRGFANEDCFDWLQANQSSLLKLTDSESYEAFVVSVAAKCVCDVQTLAEERISAISLKDIPQFRSEVQSIISQAQTVATKYDQKIQLSETLRQFSENRIVEAAAASFQKFSSKHPKTGEQFSNQIKSCDKILNVLNIKAPYEKNRVVREKVSEYKQSLIQEYIRISCDTAKNRIQNEKITSCQDYRSMYRVEIDSVYAAVSAFIDLDDWRDDMIVLAEKRICAYLSESFRKITEKICTTSQDYKNVLRECSDLKALLYFDDITEEIIEVRSAVDNYIKKLTRDYHSLMASVETLISSFQDKYFVGLKKFAERASSLTDTEKSDVQDALNQLRPQRLADYAEQYRQQTNRPLSIYSLINEYAEEGRVIASDLKYLLSHPVVLSLRGKSPDQLSAELDMYLVLAKQLGMQQSVVLDLLLSEDSLDEYSTVRIKADVFRSLLSLKLTKNQISDETEVYIYNIVKILRELGFIPAEHSFALVEMLLRCDYQQSADDLMNEIRLFKDTHVGASIQKNLDVQTRGSGKRLKIFSGILGGVAALSLTAAILLSVNLSNTEQQMQNSVDALTASVNSAQETILALNEQIAQLEDDKKVLETELIDCRAQNPDRDVLPEKPVRQWANGVRYCCLTE